MTQITSIANCKDKLSKGIVLLYGAMGDQVADQVFYLTQNNDLIQKFTGLDYERLAKSDPAVSFLEDEIADESSNTVVEGFCLVSRKCVSVDLATMPGIALFVGAVVQGHESVFSPFVDFASEGPEDEEGFDFLRTATEACCTETGEIVTVEFDDYLDSDFCYRVCLHDRNVLLNAYGFDRFGQCCVEPVSKSENYVPLTEQYVAQEGTLHLPKGDAPVFVSKFMESALGPATKTDTVKLKAYTVHHKDEGVKGISIDLA